MSEMNNFVEYDNEFCVTVISNAGSDDLISSNSNFVKVLADGLNFKNRDFEVALTDLVFTDSYSPPSPVPPTPPTPLPPVVPKFFDGKNNVFKTWLQSKVKYTTTKATVASKTVPSQVVSFVSALNTFLKIHKAPIEILSFKKMKIQATAQY